MSLSDRTSTVSKYISSGVRARTTPPPVISAGYGTFEVSDIVMHLAQLGVILFEPPGLGRPHHPLRSLLAFRRYVRGDSTAMAAARDRRPGRRRSRRQAAAEPGLARGPGCRRRSGRSPW